MKKLVVLLLVSLMATSAFATLDPDPDGIGVYFDLNGEINETFVGVNVPFFAYVTITNPTAAEVHGLEFGYSIVTTPGFEGSFFRLANGLPAGAVDLGNSTSPGLGDYVVGLASPLPAAAAVPFVTWQFLMLADFTMDFYIGASTVPSLDPAVPAYEIGGSILPLQQSTGGASTAVATVNKFAPVATEESSFGSLKSLFR